MKILCMIDSLGSGGAQTQMVNLVVGLIDAGNQVEVFIYHPKSNFNDGKLIDKGVVINQYEKNSKYSPGVIFALIKLIRTKEFDGVISYMGPSNIYAIIAKIFSFKRFKLIVSERSSKESEIGVLGPLIRYLMYRIADFIVVNSKNHEEYLKGYKWLNRKIFTIYNGYIVNDRRKSNDSNKKDFNIDFLVVGRIEASKNGLRLIDALLNFIDKYGYCPSVSWIGRQEMNDDSLEMRAKMDEVIRQNQLLSKNWKWFGERSDVLEIMECSKALIHVSLYEGLPNVICEAFTVGKPVIASNVCDNPILIGNDERGILCDPNDCESISNSIKKFLDLNNEERDKLGAAAYIFAKNNLTITRMTKEYQQLLNGGVMCVE